jgi:hypothetical protein
MKKTLIKTNNSPILVSDEEIKEGDICVANAKTYNNTIVEYRKSPCPPPYVSNLNILQKVLSQSPKLSKEVVDEIGWIDVEELALNEKIELNASAWLYNQLSETPDEDLKFCSEVVKDYWISGFQKAEELNQKKYSEEDIRKAYDEGMYAPKVISKVKEMKDEYIQYLSQPQQYSVEAEEIDGVWNVTKILK